MTATPSGWCKHRSGQLNSSACLKFPQVLFSLFFTIRDSLSDHLATIDSRLPRWVHRLRGPADDVLALANGTLEGTL